MWGIGVWNDAVKRLAVTSWLVWAITVSGLSAKCKHTKSIGSGWSSGSQTSLTSCYLLFRSRFYFRFYLNFRRGTYSSALACAWPSDHGWGRLRASPLARTRPGTLLSVTGRVTTGIGSFSRGAETKLNSLGTSSRPSWLGISVSITILSNTRDFTLEIPKYSGADLLLRQIQFLPQCNANALYQPVNGGGRRNEAKSILQLSSTELFSNRRQQLECTIRRRSA